MNDPFKEKDRMAFYSALNDAFLDMSNKKLSSTQIDRDTLINLDKAKRSLGCDNLTKMYNMYVQTMIDKCLQEETDEKVKKITNQKMEQVNKFVSA
jgi:hypothetical protein